MWELFITSLRTNLRQSIHASPLGMSQAVVLQKAGGSPAVRRDVLRFMMEAIVRKARVHQKARILGNVEFVEVGILTRPRRTRRSVLPSDVAGQVRNASETRRFHSALCARAQELDVLANRFSPGSPLFLVLNAESYPKVRFKRPYKGLKVKHF